MKLNFYAWLGGMFLGISLLVFEYFYVTQNWFVQWPDLGTYCHILGGVAVVLFHFGVFGQNLKSLNFYIKGYVYLSYTALAAIAWELFEFTLGKNIHMNMQVSIENTMWDLGCGLLGGGIGYMLLPRT